jgi:hypothetical protein
MDKWEETDRISIDYEKVLASKQCLSVTRLLAANIIAEPYMTVKDFMIGLNDDDLRRLLEIADTQDEHFGELILISEMLAQSEGLNASDLRESTHRVNVLCSFLAGESLARRGIVKIYHENMSFGDDMSNKVVMELIK